MVTSMDPINALIALVVVTTLFVSRSLIGRHLDNQRLERADTARNEREQAIHEGVRLMMAEETRRTEVIAGLICQTKCTTRPARP